MMTLRHFGVHIDGYIGFAHKVIMVITLTQTLTYKAYLAQLLYEMKYYTYMYIDRKICFLDNNNIYLLLIGTERNET